MNKRGEQTARGGQVDSYSGKADSSLCSLRLGALCVFICARAICVLLAQVLA
ncbi:hypothetical protein Cflav_PD0775 [Pedosphaera parvula Ellin514]|uniref:Uncharacterized protein n=1 Tax=Pedosphaera parvula (strain Ellin514) TaxID=320771 RepID=B9XR17_PEDPL|nr:hypothetical protein Cflav_PD0775 [Pedosphaera parvula Ellin514]